MSVPFSTNRKGQKIMERSLSLANKDEKISIHLDKERLEFFAKSKSQIVKTAFDHHWWDVANDVSEYHDLKQFLKLLNQLEEKYTASQVEEIKEEVKCILYFIEMNNTEKNESSDPWGLNWDQRKYPSITFDFIVANRVMVNGKFFEYRNNINGHPIGDMTSHNEIPWSQKSEDFMTLMRDNLFKIFFSLGSFFGDDEKQLLESINKSDKIKMILPN
tara:strand:- start:2605 stop:3255 length:651 start_codon:yes stop_codon:yes gene_type:complete